MNYPPISQNGTDDTLVGLGIGTGLLRYVSPRMGIKGCSPRCTKDKKQLLRSANRM
jgi:hypothetical protein